MRLPDIIRPLLLVAIFSGFLALKAAATTYYVDVNSTDPTPPYTNWATASTDIQSAIDISTNGDLILVNPGVYQTGGRTVNGYALTNRVVIDQAVTVESVGGPATTLIEGYQVPGTAYGVGAVRCVYMTNNAVLIGFTLTNGATMQYPNDEGHETSGGGLWCEDNSAVISNCLFSANAADLTYGQGGGAFGGTLNNCTLTENSAAEGGGAYVSVLNDCVLINNSVFENWTQRYPPGSGGGVYGCTLNQCMLAGNQAVSGGAAEASILNGCIVSNNAVNGPVVYGANVYDNGGGADRSTLINCVISGNTASGGIGGGTSQSIVTNCSFTGNSAYAGGGSYSDTLDGCILSGNLAINAGGGTYSSTLIDCTMMGNSAGAGGGANGGTLYNCVLYGNISSSTGGGVNSATVYNSALYDNSAVAAGGGAASSTLASCTLTGNSASSGGGVYSSSLTNCVVYYNEATSGTNYDSTSSLAYCCTTPLPTNGPGNIADAPDLADDFHLGEDSPCIGAGNPACVTGVDIDGNPWANPPSIGCDEFDSGSATGSLTVAIVPIFSNLVTGFTGGFSAQINGHAAISFWNFGDGTEVVNQPDVSHAWTAPGDYQVSLWAYNESNPGGVSATITVHVANEPVQYVAQGNTTPAAPYLSWATAATNIQDAVNSAFGGGGVILVSNGVYQGAYTSPEGLRCVAATQPVVLLSVNGPAATFICGSNLVGCVYLANGAMLSGFTLTNGWFPTGGGVYCASTNTIVTNCTLINNLAFEQAGYDAGIGGGAYSGTLINCTLQSNRAAVYGGGAAYSTLVNCIIFGNQGIYSGNFGGAAYCTLSNCVVAGDSRGGVGYSTLENCIIESNSPSFNGYGGGATQSTLNNCLLSGNQGYYGGGADDCVLNFCVISNNVANFSGGGVYDDSSQTILGQSNILVGNIANNGNGGGVYLGANVGLSGWSFVSNSATGNGGGIYSDGSVSNCTFVGNFAKNNGGGCDGPFIFNCTFVGNVAGMGGGAYGDLTNCLVVGNKAGYGGGIYGFADNCIINSNVATTNGGGLYSYYRTPAPVAGCAFTNNSAMNGGGAYASSESPIFSNCVFWANSATNSGGGIGDSEEAILIDCFIGNNYAGQNGGGVYNSYLGSLGYCVLSGNVALNGGGGAYNSSMTNCLVYGNSAAYGGGAYYNNPFATLLNTTIANNRAADSAGGIYGSVYLPEEVVNCIIYDNSAPTNMNYATTSSFSLAGARYCCTMPLPVAAQGFSITDFTNDPAFVNPAGSDFHLQSSSPCINSGNNTAVAGNTDLDGNPRIVGGTVDMGAYEYQTPVSMTSYHWLQQYGIPITTNTDTSDLDGTAFDVYQDWLAGLNPTNPASVLVILPLLPNNNASGITVSWESVTNLTYDLQRATNLTSAFTTIQANIRAVAGTTSYQDGSATNSGPYFYRVAVP